MRKMKQSGGLTFELLICLAILAPCLFALSLTVQRSAASFAAAKKQAAETLRAARIKSLLTITARDIDAHPFHLWPRVHKKGALTLSSGVKNRALSYRQGMKPDPRSDALTYLRLELLATHEVKIIHLRGGGISVVACPRFKVVPTGQTYNSYLALTPQGIFEMALNITSREANNCLQAQGRFIDSMAALPKAGARPELTRFIVPVSDIYTLYVDNRRRLRYLGHRGPQNIENQPVLEGVAPLEIDVIPFSDTRFASLKVGAATVTNSLARGSYMNFLLNRP